MIEDEVDADLSQSYQLHKAVAGMAQASTDGSHLGSSALVMGSMAIKGAAASAEENACGPA
jgi:hypothetical protein